MAHEINNPLAYVGNNLSCSRSRDLVGVLAMIDEYEKARRLSRRPTRPTRWARVEAISQDLDWPYVRQNLGRMIARTRDGVQRVASIVQNLRGLARTAPPKLEPALVRDLIVPAAEMVQGRGRRHHIEIVVEVGPTTRVACVSSQISQVMLNLLVNAMQAIEAAGRPEGGRIVVSARERDDEVLISIADDGCGIDAADLPRLFDPFFTTKAVGEGTGLGLSISHGIVTDHGGRIEVESNPARGRRSPSSSPRRPVACPCLPARSPRGKPDNGRARPEYRGRPRPGGDDAMTAAAKHCLLVVDDEPDVCDSVHDLLRREFRVLKAHGAEEGFKVMRDEEVHIIMTDQRMPQITGVELLKKIKAKNPQAVRMLFTGYADFESIIAAINQGHVYQFLRKPWQPRGPRSRRSGRPRTSTTGSSPSPRRPTDSGPRLPTCNIASMCSRTKSIASAASVGPAHPDSALPSERDHRPEPPDSTSWWPRNPRPDRISPRRRGIPC